MGIILISKAKGEDYYCSLDIVKKYSGSYGVEMQ